MHTDSGEESACFYSYEKGWTIVPWKIEPHSYRLLRFIPQAQDSAPEKEAASVIPEKVWRVVAEAVEPNAVTRAEENVLLLDQAEWRVDKEEWQARQDSLHTQLALLKRFAWPDWAQPYSIVDREPYHRVRRRFIITTEVQLCGARLMCERLDEATVYVNGKEITVPVDGWWVDRDLTCGHLPDLAIGRHVLEIELELDAVNRHLEWCYILGDFAVEYRGAHACITAQEKPRYWGNVVSQDMPFYGGNLNYQVPVDINEAGYYALRIPDFAGSLLRVYCDDQDCGAIAYAPYRVELGYLTVGVHVVDIRCYGNRHNSFAALHNTSPGWRWWGPPAWRSTDVYSNPVWQLRPNGILRRPLIERLD